MTALAMSGLVAPSVQAAASAGDLIKMAGNSSVYYLGADGKRYVFPNESTYFSWYSDFSGVVTIPASELQSYPLGGNVTMRAGTKLVKIVTDPSVYAVEPNGNLRKIQSEAQAAALYGTDWAKRVVDVADSFFVNYSVGAPLADGMVPVGSLVKASGGSDVYYYDGTNYRMIANEAAFNANRFNWSNVLTRSSVTAGGSAITGAETALVNTAQSGGSVVTGSGIMVSLSANTAPSSTLIYGQALANLGSFNFTAANDGEVKVTSLKVRRTGVSADAILSAVYLYDGNNRLTDNATVSANYVTFNNPSGLFTVAAGTTKTITVKSNISSSTGDGSQVGVAIEGAAHVTSTGANVTGSFPLNGNIMSISSATLATVSMGATTPSTTSVDAGQTELSVWKSTATIGVREVTLEHLTLRQIGSINTNDLQNLKFYVDGVQKGATMQIASNNYVTFDFSSSPVTLNTGGRILEVRADVVGGSSKNYSFSLQRATDIAVKDTQFGAYVTVGGTMPATTGTISINSGTLSVTKTSDSSTGNVTKDASGVSLGKFEFKANGESIKVENLRVAVVVSGNPANYSLRNGAVFANGAQVGSNASIHATTSGAGYVDFSLGSSLVVNPGSPVMVEIRADIFDNTGANDVADDQTITSRLVVYTNGAQRLTSLGYINVPTANTDGNTLTVKTGTVSLSKQLTYGNQGTTVPKTNYKLGAFVLSGNNIEDVNINSFEFNFTGADQWTVAQLSDVYLKYGSKTSSVKATVTATGNVWSVSEVLGKSENMVVEVYGNVSTFTVADDNDTMTTAMIASGTTVGSAQSVNTGAALSGQVITAKVGSIASSVDSSTPVSALVRSGQTVDLTSFRLTTTNDNYTLTEAVVKLGGAAAAANVSSLILKDGSNVVATAPVVLSGGVYMATFTGLNFALPADNYKALTVAGELVGITATMGSTGANLIATLDSFKANNSQGAETADGTDRAGNAIYVYKSVPTVANQALPTTLLTAGTQTLAKVKVSSDTNTVGWKKIVFSTTKTAAVVITDAKLYDDSTGLEVPGVATIATLGDGNTSGSVSFVATTEQSISGEKTYSLKATVGGTIADNSYVSTNIGSASMAYAAPAAYGTVAGTNATFVWSDQSLASHGEGTLDWNNNFLVKNIPTDSQTLTK